MADFSPNNSLLLKMPSHSPNFSSLLFYGQNHGEAAPANANAAAAAAMVENASLESSSAVVDTSPQDSASPMERKRKTTEDSATLSSAQSKVVATYIHSHHYCHFLCNIVKKNAYWFIGLQAGEQEQEGEEAPQGD